MSKVFIHPKSPYWCCDIKLANGQRTRRSTKIPNKASLKDKAEQVRVAMQSVEDKATQGNNVTNHVKKVFNEILEQHGHEKLNHDTVEHFLNNVWLKGIKSDSTRERYKRAVTLFLESLGSKAKAPIADVSYNDVLRYIDSRQPPKVAPMTLSLEVTCLSAAFTKARKTEIITTNPFEKALVLKPLDDAASEKEDFTADEVKKLLSTATGDWLTMILLGCYTGARATDCSNMEWNGVDFNKGEITFQDTKNDEIITMPMHASLRAHLEKIAGDKPETYLCPSLAGKETKGAHGLSQNFIRVMIQAGVDPKIVQGKGARQFSKKSFHSLRHTANSIAQANGVDQETRMAMFGWKTKKINDKYTHIKMDKKREAIAKMPSLL